MNEMAPFYFSFYSIISYIFCCMFIHCLIPLRYNRHPRLCLFCTFAVLFIVETCIFRFTTPWSSMFLPGNLFLCCICFTKGTIIHKCLTGCITYLMMFLGEMLSYLLAVFLNFIFPDLHLVTGYLMRSDDTRSYIFYAIAMFGVLLILYFLLRSVFQKYNYLLSTGALLQIFFPLVTSLYTISCFFWSSVSWKNVLIATIVITPIYWITFIVLFRGLKNLSKMQAAHHELLMKKQYLEQQIEHISELEKEYTKIYKWNHDIKNHIFSINYFIREERYSDATDYIENILK